LYETLRAKGHVYLPYEFHERWGDGASVHVVVVYGMITKSDGTVELQVMDPMRGLTTRDLVDIRNMAKVGIGTKKEE
jgi:hypothetical protein